MRCSSLSPLLRRAFSTSAATPPTSTTATTTTNTSTQPTMDVKSLSDDLYTSGKPSEIVRKFLKACENDEFRRKTGTYEEVVRRLIISRQRHYIRTILDAQKKYPDITREGFCVRLISLYGRSGMHEDALRLFDEMPKLNSKRTILSLNAVLAACLKSKQFVKVEGLFRDLPKKVGVEPDVFSYNIVIKAFLEMGQLDKATSMLDEMEKNGCQADRVSFNTLLQWLYGRDKHEDGEKIWDKMMTSGVAPDAWSYNARLSGYTSAEKVQQAVDMVEEMKQKGLNPDVFTYDSLIKAYCNAGDLDGARKLYGEMRSHCKPNRYVYATLLPFVCEKGDVDLAFGLCKDIFGDRCLVDRGILQKAVDVLVNDGSKWNEAIEVLNLANFNNYCNYKLKIM